MRMKITKARRLILEELRKCRSHPTADELFRRLRLQLPRVSLATIYRNLELLERRGLIRRLDLGSGRRHYDGNIADHAHIRCIECGAVADICSPGRRWWHEIQQESGYSLIGSQIEVIGLCPRCLKRKKGNERRR